MRFPLPSSELVIPVYNSRGELSYISKREKKRSGNATLFRVVGENEKTAEKTVGVIEVEGQMVRGKRMVASKYFFGPGRDPVLEIVEGDDGSIDDGEDGLGDAPPPYVIASTSPDIDWEDEEKKKTTKPPLEPSIRSDVTGSTLAVHDGTSFKINAAWTSRACSFTDPKTNRSFSWKHERTVLANGEKAKLLSLYWEIPDVADATSLHPALSESPTAKKEKKGKQSTRTLRVAQLVRSDSTRTPGTHSSYAGNGGDLELSKFVRLDTAASAAAAAAGSLLLEKPKPASDIIYGVGCEKSGEVIDEAMVVATCLVMMKREVDRRRAVQISIMAGAASGGG